MEATATARDASMPMPSTPSRKEWRAVSDNHSVQNVGDEELELTKLRQSDERTIYEVQQGRELLDGDFCSITFDWSLDHDLLQQRLHNIARQREELQQMQIELRAQMIARSEIVDLQNSFDAQIKEHVNVAANFQEQLQQRDQTIRELERRLEDKEREVHAIKLDNEAAWAKEDLFREQDKELATIRRERDHSEAERAQHITQLHDFQEHIREKEKQLMELQEQHRVAQETIVYKDERLREAQAWITQVQEMDAMQSSTIQAELRECTEQYNQLWLGFQRQFAEMERLHMHTVQQLQLELADARERNGNFTDETRVCQESSKDVSQFGQNNGNQLDINGGATSGGTTTTAHPNGNSDNISSYASSGNASAQVDHAAGAPLAPSSIVGMPYLSPEQLTALHPFFMHQQGVPQSMQSNAAQSHVGHFQSMSSLQQWHNQQDVTEGVQISAQNELTPSQVDRGLTRSDQNYNYEISVNGQDFPPDYLDVPIGQGVESNAVISSSIGEAQVHDSINRSYLTSSQAEHGLQLISSQFHDSLKLESIQPDCEAMAQKQSFITSAGGNIEAQVLTAENAGSVSNLPPSDGLKHQVSFDKNTIHNETGALLPETFVSTGQTNTLIAGTAFETVLLDERSLLACIVRTIPPGDRIHISSTLPNRLGKMLAPLHWHDYKKKYGKLDDFVAVHPELFVIEDNYIQLREGAQKMIAAAAAAAKVAAAVAASSSYSSCFPTVAVTPMAQSQRLKQNQLANGVCVNVSGPANIKILSKSNYSRQINSPKAGPTQSSILETFGNGVNLDRSNRSSSQSSCCKNGRSSSNFGAKHQGRLTGAAALSSRR